MKRKNIKKPGLLFEFHDKLYEVIGWSNGPTVIIEPVRERDYEKCECGRPLPNQQHEYVLDAPILQNHIGKVYEADDAGIDLPTEDSKPSAGHEEAQS